jgi:hypothetical protein
MSKLIQEIAYQTWPDVYGKFFVSQLDYMLKSFYSKEVLLDNMVHKGIILF